MTELVWRTSSFSGGGEHCVAVADADTSVAMRNSKHPDRGTLVIERAAFAAMVTDIRGGALDDLT